MTPGQNHSNSRGTPNTKAAKGNDLENDPRLARQSSETDGIVPPSDAKGTGIVVKRVQEGVCPNCGERITFGSAIPLSKSTCTACGTVFLTPGQVDVFVLVERIGAGEMGEIYRARDEALNRDVAIKVVRAARADDKNLRERLRKEAQAAARLTHPHVAQVFALGFSNGYPYLVMELVGGEDLNTKLQRDKRIDERTALQVANDIANGLQALHNEGLTHGDIKPGNIVLDLNGKAKLVDFGLSGMTRMDSTGAIAGTPHYIAPELLRGATDNCRTDIYSLGATLYHLLTGKPPFDGPSAIAIARARLVKPADQIGRHAPELSNRTKHIVMRMLSREPAQRYPDCAAVIAEIREALNELNHPVQTSSQSRLSNGRQATIDPPKTPPHLRRKTPTTQTDHPSTAAEKQQTSTQQSKEPPQPKHKPQRRQRRKSSYAILSAIVISAAFGAHYGIRAYTSAHHQVSHPIPDPVRPDASTPAPAPASVTRPETKATEPDRSENRMPVIMPDFPHILTPQWVSVGLGGRPRGSTGWGGDGMLILQIEGSSSGSDVYRYVHAGAIGDFVFSAKFVSLHNLSLTGLMVRESSDDYGPNIFFGIQDNGTLLLQLQRTGQPPQVVLISDDPVSLPSHLRIVRIGDLFQASISGDGVSWEPFAERSLSLPERTRVGLAVSCQVPGMLGTAEFRNVTIKVPAIQTRETSATRD